MKPGFVETAQSAECEGLGFIPRKGAGCDVTVLGERVQQGSEKERQADLWGSLASHPSPLGQLKGSQALTTTKKSKQHFEVDA